MLLNLFLFTDSDFKSLAVIIAAKPRFPRPSGNVASGMVERGVGQPYSAMAWDAGGIRIFPSQRPVVLWWDFCFPSIKEQRNVSKEMPAVSKIILERHHNKGLKQSGKCEHCLSSKKPWQLSWPYQILGRISSEFSFWWVICSSRICHHLSL